MSTNPIGGNAFWLQAKVGEWVLLHRDIPGTLLFPFTEASRLPFHAHEWLELVSNLFKDDARLQAFVAHYDGRYVLTDGSQYNNFTGLPFWRQGKWRPYFSDHRAALFQRADVHEGKLQQ